ncbi:maltose O-acetyltransferase [Flavobacterium cauense R2A-7]|uniref:Maltose O-acetyltransferase n=1 Tax=Flavobacterium cauense R2A-7 TaxID=1341154 RepID=A0A562LR80_9FLAO|nr:acyltransferase [Flavobacterium cauense]KGO83095.1 hypothetical protein Q762_04965 [Flavobacterium cauense R2A-7]TWI10135.1 maltose O-acetyltransferase [Flavobacterium cauense R2A-7]
MGIFRKIRNRIFVSLRIWKYKVLSDCKSVSGTPEISYPVLLKGEGTILFGNKVKIGVELSPGFYSGYGYIEARNPESRIEIGNNVRLNNGFSMVALQKISIGDDALIGLNFSVSDSDFHHLRPSERFHPNPPSEQVNIGNNVFIGSDVTVLKGVTIGDNSVVGSNSVVTKNVPDNVIVAGNPARIIREL